MSIETDAIREALITLEGKLHPSDIYGHAELKEARSELDQLEQEQEWISSIAVEPPEDTLVWYYFKPFNRVFLGKYAEGSFYSGSGFCDRHDAPYWMLAAVPAPPKETE